VSVAGFSVFIIFQIIINIKFKNTMKKKTYKQPEMKVVKLEQTDIICTSQFPNPQNESYEEEEEVNSIWFN